MINKILYEILESERVIDLQGNSFQLHSQIPKNDGIFISDLIKSYKPKRSLEIGLAYGVSALYICEALKEVGAEQHVVIDPLQYSNNRSLHMKFDESDRRWEESDWTLNAGWRGIGMLNLKRAGFGELIRFIGEPSHLALPKLAEEEAKFDFAFIDGWHTFDYVMLDFFYTDLMLKSGGVVVFDDSKYPSIRKFLRFVLLNRR